MFYVMYCTLDLAHTVQNMEITFPGEKIDPHLKHLLKRMLDKDYRTRITLDRIIQDDWVTNEGTDALFTEEDIIEEQNHQYVGHVLGRLLFILFSLLFITFIIILPIVEKNFHFYFLYH